MTAMKMKEDEYLWAQRYRPQVVADTILPENTKNIFQRFVDDKKHTQSITIRFTGNR